MTSDNNNDSSARGISLQDRFVLAFLALISGYLVFDTLYHVIFPAGHRLGDLFFARHHATFVWVLPLALQLFCVIYIWRRFRSEASLRQQLALAMEQREDEMTKFQDILESTPTRISIQSPEYKILYQNPSHAAAIGLHAGEYCYKAYSNNDSICEACPLEKTFADGKIHSMHKSNVINGQKRYLELVAAPLKKADGTIVAGIEVVQDTTEQVLHERHIQQLSERLEENNRELRAFGSALAHDLRQPLTRTYMAAQVLDEEVAADHNDKALLEAILKGCEQMEELVEGMLTLSRVDNEELQHENFELAPLVDEIMLDLQALDPSRRFSLHKPASCEVWADRKLLRILLANLLGNAWKYTRERAVTEIDVSCLRRGTEIELTVADNGIGFSMIDATDLFRPFTRLHREKSYPGIGIGLATSRRVVHRHGGRIWADSHPGQGAKFSFTLPLIDSIQKEVRINSSRFV